MGRGCKVWILTDPLASGRMQEKGEALQPSLPAWAKFPPQTILHPVSCSDLLHLEQIMSLLCLQCHPSNGLSYPEK